MEYQRMFSRTLRRFARIGLTLALVVVIYTSLWGEDILHVATGSVSRSLCAAVFVSGVDAGRLYTEEQLPRLRLVNWALHYSIDHDRHEVRTTIAGGFGSRAVYRNGIGCLVVHGDVSVPEAAGVSAPTFTDAFADQTAIVEPSDLGLRHALDQAFS
jgi:hypothetical protein